MLLLLKIKNPFLFNYLCFLRPIATKLGVYVAYVKRQLGIATKVSVIKVKVTLANKRKSVFALYLKGLFAY